MDAVQPVARVAPGPLKLKRFRILPIWSRLDAYIFSEIHTPFLMAMLVYNGIFFIKTLGSVSELSDGKFEIPFEIVALAILSQLPEILFVTVSLSFLFAALAALGRMSADSEIIAPQSLGLSPWRMSRPILVYGTILSVLIFGLMNLTGPQLKRNWQVKWRDFVENAALPNITPGVIMPMSNRSVLYVDHIDRDKLADMIFINQDDRAEEILVAKKATIYSNRNLQLFNAYKVFLNLKPNLEDNGEAVRMIKTRELERAIPIPKDIGGGLRIEANELMSTATLWKTLKSGNVRDPEMWAEFLQRLTSPLICLIFGLFAVPLAARHSRLRKSTGFGLSLLIIGIYFTMDKLGLDAATQGKLDPVLGLCLPPLIFLIIGILLQIGKHHGWNRRIERLGDKVLTLVLKVVRRFLLIFKKRGKIKVRETADEPETLIQTFIFPSKLDIYVTRSFLSIYLLVQSSLLIMLLLFEYTQISKAVNKYDASLEMVLRYLLYKIPPSIYLSMFSCLLISVLILFAVMSKNQEINVIRAGGGNLQRLCLPLLLCGVLASGLSYYLENNFLPQTYRLGNRLAMKIRNARENLFYRDVWMKRPSGDILNYQVFDQKTNALRGVRIYRLLDQGKSKLERIDLPSLEYRNNGWVSPDGGTAMEFQFGEKDFFFKPHVVARGSFFDLKLDLEDLSRKKHKASEFSIQGLKDYLKYLKNLGYDDTAFQTALYAKYAQPLFPFIMMLLAMPLGFQFGRKGAFYGIGTGLVAGLVFLGLFELVKEMGSSGLIAPMVAGWVVVVLFGFVALFRFINLE